MPTSSRPEGRGAGISTIAIMRGDGPGMGSALSAPADAGCPPLAIANRPAAEMPLTALADRLTEERSQFRAGGSRSAIGGATD